MEKIRILYAENYDLVLFTAKQLLEAEGWEVEVCRDGAAALKKLEGAEHFDLLIIDDRLDGANGAELTARAQGRARLRSMPIILFTAEHTNGDPAAHEADARLSKPGGLKELVPTCRRLLPHGAARQGVAHDVAAHDGVEPQRWPTENEIAAPRGLAARPTED